MSDRQPDRNRADQIFDEALDLSGAERETYLRKACGGDTDLEALVRRLLANCETGPDDSPDTADLPH